MTTFIECLHPQRSPKWFAARGGKVTGSCVSDVLTKVKTGESTSRANYRAQLVVERITGLPAGGDYTNAAIQRGTDLEPVARVAYEVKTGSLALETGFWHDDNMGASPDGLIDDDGLLEIKCPSLATHFGYLKAGTVPSKYVPQIQMQMFVTGREWCDFVSFCPEYPEHLRLMIVRCKRDDEYISNMVIEINKFLSEVQTDVLFLEKKQ